MQNSVTEEIKERLSIEEVVSSYIKLEKSGINLRACCPFHNEKTPSFFVSPDRGSFYCFGCSKGGDIFTFVEEMEGIDFKETLKILAEKAGVDISKYNIGNREQGTEKSKELYTIIEQATLFFERELEKNTKAKEYIKSRGIVEQTSRKFRIGYAKDEWQALYEFLKDKKYSDDQIIKTGLVIKNENGRIYDRFRGRVIFPISDDRGRVIAYSARILTNDKDQPKYINSPETALFNKSKTLYGFNFAKSTIRKHDFAILTEGQLDVIMAHQVGFTNTVASSGTSFTEEQLQIIKRHTNNLLVAFDGDSAGLNSSKKVWELALQNEMDVKILPLKEGQDPADIIFENPENWKKLVKNSRHLIEHLIENIKTLYSDTRKQQKEVQKEIYPYLKSIKSYTDKSFFVEKVSEAFGIDKDAIWQDVNLANREQGTQNHNNSEQTENRKESFIKKSETNPREILFGIYLSGKIKKPEQFLEKIKQFISDDLIQEMQKRKDKILFETDAMLEKYQDISALAKDMFTQLKMYSLEKEKQLINEKIKNDTEDERDLMKKLVQITNEIETVKKKGCTDLEDVI